MSSDPFHKTITSETLERDRRRREKERGELADKYLRAADILDGELSVGTDQGIATITDDHGTAARLLREEAERWRR